MRTTTIEAPEGEGVDNIDWLQAIADHPELTITDLVAVYDLLGQETSLTEDQLRWGLWNLETKGFLHTEDHVTYTPLLPEGAPTGPKTVKEPEVVTRLAADPDWLNATVHQTGVGQTLTVYRSAAMRDTDRSYRVVADYLARHNAECVHSSIVKDPTMIFRSGELIIFRVLVAA